MTRLRALRLAVLLPALAALGAVPVRAAAQAAEWRASVHTSVTVAPPPVLLETSRDLYFGSVGAGSDVDVPAQPPYAAGTWSAAARFSNLRKTVAYGITVTLPTELSRGTGPGLPVTWSGTQYGWLCVWNTTSGTPGVCAVDERTFSPAAHTGTPLVVDFPNNTPGNNVFAADVYIGGRLTIPSSQPLAPGLYTAPIRITLAPIN